MPESVVRVWFDDKSFLDVLESQLFAYLWAPRVDVLEWLWPRCDTVMPEDLW